LKFQPIRKHNLTSSHSERPNDTKIINNVVDHQSYIYVCHVWFKFVPVLNFWEKD